MHAWITTLWEESTNLQTKISLYKVQINVITAQLHPLQMQMAAQSCAMNSQTIGPCGHNNTWCNKQGSHGGGGIRTTTPNITPPIMHHAPVFNQSPLPDYSLVPPAIFHQGQTPMYLPSSLPAISTLYFSQAH